MPRYFSLSEAREALPALGRLIREAVQARARHQQTELALQSLAQRILLNGGTAVDTGTVEQWKATCEASGTSLKSALERIDQMGVLVKDLDTGLVDFPTLYRGDEVYLCWRMDEPDIEFWHEVSAGFAGRRPIDAAFIANHRGQQQA